MKYSHWEDLVIDRIVKHVTKCSQIFDISMIDFVNSDIENYPDWLVAKCLYIIDRSVLGEGGGPD